MIRTLTIITAVVAALNISVVNAADWPQFRGPNRDGKSTETGLLKQWPESGPKLLWAKKGLGKAFASISIADGTVYAAGLKKKQGFLFAFDTDGNLKWKKPYGPEWTKCFSGARSRRPRRSRQSPKISTAALNQAV